LIDSNLFKIKINLFLIFIFNYYKSMQGPRGSKDDLEIDDNITYSLTTDKFSRPLTIINRSNHYYAYKVYIL
jgi:hypothetical protein